MHQVKWFNYLRRIKAPTVGVNPAWWLHHRSLARNTEKNKYLFANEWIAANLGWFLRLPIPPFALMEKSGRRFFASLDYGSKEVAPSDMQPERLCECLPDEAAAIVMFDVLIANWDRHEGNLKVDDRDQPTRVEVFDHDCSLFGSQAGRGCERLQSVTGKLGLTFGVAGTRNVHKLARFIRSSVLFEKWVGRIQSIPNAFIESVCEQAGNAGLTAEEVEVGARFLIYRKDDLRDIVAGNKPFFPKVKDWLTFP